MYEPAVSLSTTGGGNTFLARWGPLRRLFVALLGAMVLAAALAVALVGLDPVPLGLVFAGFLVGAIFSLGVMRQGYPHPVLGSGNLVTLVRMALIAALLAPILGSAVPWTVVVVASLALLLDGADGWLARREGRVSDFGARLDTEIDSAFTLVLATSAWVTGIVGPLVLLLAFPRYGFVAAARFLPWLKAPLPESFARKVVCVTQVVVLIVLGFPLTPVWLVVLAVVVGSTALVWSFGRDVLWLWRVRP